MSNSANPPSRFDVWKLAARPRTLPAASAPVIAASAAAFADGHFDPLPALAALLGALLLQIGANFANDLFDFQKGADTAERTGPLRVTSAGLVTPTEIKTAMAVVFGLAALCGVYLALHAGWPVIAIGMLSILGALAYTGGPYPLGYHGLGEVAVFIFFGLAAVCGTYYVQALRLSPAAVWTAVPLGLLTVAILIVNNLRDIATDRASGKHTLAARFGAAWTRREYVAVITAAYLMPPAMWLSGATSGWVMLAWLSLPLVFPLFKKVHTLNGRALNQVLAQTGQLELAYALALALGSVLQRLLG